MKFEKERLEDIKHSNLACYISRTKNELEEWWMKCFIGEEERSNYKPYLDGNSILI